MGVIASDGHGVEVADATLYRLVRRMRRVEEVTADIDPDKIKGPAHSILKGDKKREPRV